ncbi:hemerythrin domain-containing protein [Nitrospira sp. Kam-Ns4a]
MLTSSLAKPGVAGQPLVRPRRGGQGVDPVALLTREHGVILERLRLIEVAAAPLAAGGRKLAGQDRKTLRELLRFFTDRVRVHFRREEVLIRALGRALNGDRRRGKGFESLPEEHRALKADAARIARRVEAEGRHRNGPTGMDPLRVARFVRRYRVHIAWEERILFTLAAARLTAEQQDRIGRRMLEV